MTHPKSRACARSTAALSSSTNSPLKISRRDLIKAACLGALLPFAAPMAYGNSSWKPTQPVRIINGFSPGGAADQLCRILAQALSPLMGQSVVVETKTGSGGFIAANTVAQSAADGHTIGLATMGMLTISSQLRGANLPLDVEKDLTLITSVAGIYSLLVASPEAPFSTFPEMLEYAKANPGKLTYASTGIGSAPNLAAEMLKSLADIDIVHIPYRGGSQALIDLSANRVDVLIGNMPDFLPQVKSGQIRAIAFAGDRASPQLPDIPLIKQWIPDYSVTNWFGIVAPANLPAEILASWNNALLTVLQDEDVRERMLTLGMEIMGGSPEDFHKLVQHDRERWLEIITSANITLE